MTYCALCGALMEPHGMVAAAKDRPAVCVECEFRDDAPTAECWLTAVRGGVMPRLETDEIPDTGPTL